MSSSNGESGVCEDSSDKYPRSSSFQDSDKYVRTRSGTYIRRDSDSYVRKDSGMPDFRYGMLETQVQSPAEQLLTLRHATGKPFIFYFHS